MQCARCGATVMSRARFCPVCGQPLAVAADSDTSTATPEVVQLPPGVRLDTSDLSAPTASSSTSRLAVVPVVEPWRRWWWKILLIGIGLYGAVNSVFTHTQNVYLLPQLFVIGTFLVPIVYIAYLYEDGTLYDVPLSKIALIFFFGGVVGSMVASLLEDRLITSNVRGIFGQLTFLNASIVGLSEELAKLIVLVPFVAAARKRYPTIMHGIVLGAAAGMGFAAFESMGYAFVALITSQEPAVMNGVIRMRALLAPLGHGTWTAIIAATMWRESVSGRPILNLNVLLAFIVAVVLHLLWDFLPALVITGLPILHLIIGLIGILVLRFFLLDAKGGQGAAYQERNLATALRLYVAELNHDMASMFRGKPRSH